MDRTAAASARNRQLDGLRGYAALAVAVFHAILGLDVSLINRILLPTIDKMTTPYEVALKIALAIFNGETAVVIFFVMSGAVLVQSLKRTHEPVWALAATFAVRRVLRIYPTLIVCLAIAVALFPASGIVRPPSTFLINLSLYDWPLIGASWTLNVEMFATPLIFIGFLAYARFREWGLLVAMVAIVMLLKLPALRDYLIFFRMFAFCFALGVFVPTAWGRGVALLLPRWSWIAFLTAAVFAKHVPLGLGPLTTGTIHQISAALLVLVVYHDRASGLCGLLRRPTSVFFGRLSYTFYLGNVLVLEPLTVTLASYAWAVANPLQTGLASSVVIIGLGLVIAYVLTVTVEEPAIRLGRKVSFGGPRDAAARDDGTANRVSPPASPSPGR